MIKKRTLRLYGYLLGCLFNVFVIGHGFIAGTPIETPGGFVPIEKLQVNDLVISRDKTTNSFVQKPITRINKKSIPALFRLTVSDGENSTQILVAPGQRFYLVKERKWCTVKNLHPGKLLRQNGSEAVLVIAIEKVKAGADVYELSVDELHNFYISRQRVLTHNIWPAIGYVANAAWAYLAPTITTATSAVATYVVSTTPILTSLASTGPLTLFTTSIGGLTISATVTPFATIMGTVTAVKGINTLYKGGFSATLAKSRLSGILGLSNTGISRNLPPGPRIYTTSQSYHGNIQIQSQPLPVQPKKPYPDRFTNTTDNSNLQIERPEVIKIYGYPADELLRMVPEWNDLTYEKQQRMIRMLREADAISAADNINQAYQTAKPIQTSKLDSTANSTTQKTNSGTNANLSNTSNQNHEIATKTRSGDDKTKKDNKPKNSGGSVCSAGGAPQMPGGPNDPRKNNNQYEQHNKDNPNDKSGSKVKEKTEATREISYIPAATTPAEIKIEVFNKFISGVDQATAAPIIAKNSPSICAEKIVGMQWHDGKVVFRLDHDPTKGAHFNIKDFRPGKSLELSVEFAGGETLIKELLEELNSFEKIAEAEKIYKERMAKASNSEVCEKYAKLLEKLETLIKKLK